MTKHENLSFNEKEILQFTRAKRKLVPLLKLTAVSDIRKRKAARDVSLQQCQTNYTQAGVLRMALV